MIGESILISNDNIGGLGCAELLPDTPENADKMSIGSTYSALLQEVSISTVDQTMNVVT
jgi:hypothetical protein